METVGTVSMTLVAQVMTLAAHLDWKSEQGSVSEWERRK